MTLAGTQRALQMHIVDGDERIAALIDSSHAAHADYRLRVYSDAFRLRLIEALQANYPVLAKFSGEEAFARLAQEYLAVYPSRHFPFAGSVISYRSF